MNRAHHLAWRSLTRTCVVCLLGGVVINVAAAWDCALALDLSSATIALGTDGPHAPALIVAVVGNGATVSFAGAAAVVALSYGLARLLRQIDIDEEATRLWGAAVSIGLLYLILRIDIVGEPYLLGLGWLGVLPSAQNLGSFSTSVYPEAATFIALARWTDTDTAANWNADYVWFNADGTELTESVNNPAFQGLDTEHWYRLSLIHI